MSVLQKIFTPSSRSKKTSLLSSDLGERGGHRRESLKVSSPKLRKGKANDEGFALEESDSLMRSVSLTVNSDPVPTSFKSGSGLAGQDHPLTSGISASPTRLSGSFASAHPHPSTLGSSASRPNQRSLLEKMQSNSSFHMTDGIRTGAGGSNTGGGAVSMWRLPWTQQKVTMCPNCNRPRQCDRSAYVSRTAYAASEAAGASALGEDISEADGDSSSDDAGPIEGQMPEAGTYCRCGAALLDGNNGGSNSAAATSAPPTVFLVETERSSAMVLPETIAQDSDSENEASKGQSRSYKLSLVSPLTSAMLQTRDGHVQPSLGPTSRHKTAASAPKNVRSWLHDQQTSGTPTLSSKAAAKSNALNSAK